MLPRNKIENNMFLRCQYVPNTELGFIFCLIQSFWYCEQVSIMSTFINKEAETLISPQGIAYEHLVYT